MRNPFIVSGYVSPEYFCDREKESVELIRKVTNGNNLVLISSRRMGKTGLIDHCFGNEAIAGRYYTFYIDIYATSNLQEFVFKLGKEIFESLKPKGRKFVDFFFNIISSLRPAFKLDEKTGAPIFDIGIGEIRSPEVTLEEIFIYLEKADKQCIVAIDEFQQINKYPEENIEAILRTHIQRCRNAVFIYSGSRRTLMQNIFFSSSRPFYQSAALLSLEAINEKTYIKFAQQLFSLGNKTVKPDVIRKTYRLFEGHTWYLQAIMNELYSLLDDFKPCSVKMFQQAVADRIASYESLYLGTLNLLSDRQKELLYAIAREGKAVEILSGDFIRRHGLHSAGSVQTSAKYLIDKDIITKEDNFYLVYDRFFGLWLQKHFGTGLLPVI